MRLRLRTFVIAVALVAIIVGVLVYIRDAIRFENLHAVPW